MLEQLAVPKRPEMGLRVSDIDDEQHRRPLCSARDGERVQALRAARLAPVRRRRGRAAAEVDPVQAGRSAADDPDAFGPLRYGGKTVPGMRIGGERFVGSRTIMRRLDELAPEPPLLPPSGIRRPRGCWRPSGGAMRSFRACLAGSSTQLSCAARPPWRATRATPTAAAAGTAAPGAAAHGPADGPQERSSRRERSRGPGGAAGPARPGRRWIADGLLGGDPPNAADLQIGSTIRLLMSIGDVRPLIEGRPAAQLTRYFPPMVGEVPAGVLPAPSGCRRSGSRGDA